MLLYSLFIFLIAVFGVTYGAMSVADLARCIMSEASIGNKVEQTAIGFACQRNSNHATGQSPTASITQLARDILDGKVVDPTKGANHWYSPSSMPKETQSSLCKSPIGSGYMDCTGGLENACGATKNYKPSWATANEQVIIAGVRDCYYKFFKL